MDYFDENLKKMAEKEDFAAEKLPEGYDEFIEDCLNRLPEKHSKKRMSFKTAVVLAAALTATLSITVAAAANYVQKRMEAMNQEEKLNYFADAASGSVADFYSRELTEAEKKRMNELSASYRDEGLFPEGELCKITDAAQYQGEGLAFMPAKSTFFLPEKLSDEDLLQIIDYRAKREYSLHEAARQIEEGNTTDYANIEVPLEEEISLHGKDLEVACEDGIHICYAAAGGDMLYLGDPQKLFTMDPQNGALTPMKVQAPEGKNFQVMATDAENNLCVIVGMAESASSEEMPWSAELWKITPNGDVISRFEVPFTQFLAVDSEGRYYLTSIRIGGKYQEIFVYDADGKQMSKVKADRDLRALCRGKDGNVYGVLMEGEDWIPAVVSFDPEKGCFKNKYSNVLPVGLGAFHGISAGIQSDLLIHNASGVYSYNLGDDKAALIRAPYELPNAGIFCFTEDGRALFPMDEIVSGEAEDMLIYTKKLYLLEIGEGK